MSLKIEKVSDLIKELQDFKEILETEKLLDQAKKDVLIEMFRENM